ncbi:33729_t:CDS:1, partial [Gigaspora margarita]
SSSVSSDSKYSCSVSVLSPLDHTALLSVDISRLSCDLLLSPVLALSPYQDQHHLCLCLPLLDLSHACPGPSLHY